MGWNKRWFVFDRQSKTLVYFASRRSQKPRGIIYFKNIQETYPDHNQSKYSKKHGTMQTLTFTLKCERRTYFLAAENSECMRIWVDALTTGAEGNFSFFNKL